MWCGVRSAESAEIPAARRKAPYRLLFSNDTTNITTCVSPFHNKRELFRPQMLEATVDETAGTGIQVHLLQPGLGWVPWWQSKAYPPQEHVKWFRERTGAPRPDSYCEYAAAGGDIVEVFVKRCRLKGLTPFISLRLNDGHHLRNLEEKNTRAAGISRFYWEHPQFRLGANAKDWNEGVFNWAIPEVRAHKLAFIRELCENYDLDGFEMDFMRHPSYFQSDKTTPEQRVRIMTEFVGQVRDALDRTAGPGRHRWLCARIPCYAAAHEALGLDAAAMARAGVEMLNLSPHYWTVQQTDLAAIRQSVPAAAVYLEMTHCTGKIPPPPGAPADQFALRLTTPEQFYTTAHLVYSRKADGVSAFNFVYYREGETPPIGEANAPPFHVFKHLGDPDWLARRPQHYVVGFPPAPFPMAHPLTEGRALRPPLGAGQRVEVVMDMAPPAGGWKKGGRLRIQSRAPMPGNKWEVSFNGETLPPTEDVSEPYPNPYPFCLGNAQTLRAWTAPAGIMRDGANKIEIVMREGRPAQLVFVDLATT